ncbi:type II toxin-antitoxin system ParD family antitoxin [Testudinibacter aquarius]|uniref:Antitoxin ParD n=1 Tax=Testudinibacter aquarius TaxID=1524974 RepID=A0A4V2W230_9PAST|nr:type II toxin-antitoxin system ParD family antitoxin [Testudinibacter aquarius]KAE9527513.1 antitoxin [Testudinibacter aquarius]TCV86459.1 antitoxin ParD1/3/4 [Testudinibacter aquarius]TNG91546.1 type II toxin-antitoxin system ParD family antitoxin [Testudinibacter aquarius]
MARTTSVTLGQPLTDFITRMVESGRYGSTSEVMRTALRLLEEQEAINETLRLAILAGDQSGESDLTLHDIFNREKQLLNV